MSSAKRSGQASKYQAPDAWQLWHHPDPSSDGWECLLYSDAYLDAPYGPHPLGPFTFWATGVDPSVNGSAEPRLVLRIPRANPVLEWQEDGKQPGPTREMLLRNARWWLGMGVDDEVASLLSLALGVRLRSGGLVRRFESGGDPAGVPELHNHHAPQLPPAPQHLIMLPQLRDARADLLEGLALMRTLPDLSPTSAVELTKAAREYAAAVWIADSDAEQAWLRLVTAIEVVAVHTQVHENDHVELFTEAHPQVAERLLKDGGPETLAFIADQFAGLLLAGKRFRRFATRHAPPAPDQRPQHAGWQVDWEDLDPALKAIYRYRSDLLHEAKAFPPMMVLGHPEQDENGAMAECPEADAFFASGTAGWEPGAVPMYLWTFAHLVRGALLNWWREQIPADALNVEPYVNEAQNNAMPHDEH